MSSRLSTWVDDFDDGTAAEEVGAADAADALGSGGSGLLTEAGAGAPDAAGAPPVLSASNCANKSSAEERCSFNKSSERPASVAAGAHAALGPLL